MDAARLQAVLDKGYKVAASRIGPVFTLYRPASATSVIEAGNIVTTMNASMANYGHQFAYGRAENYDDTYYHGLMDRAQAQLFDYLVGEQGTYFIAAMEPIKPPLCVRCDRTVTIKRAGGSGANCEGVGLGSYGGTTAASEEAIMTGWPCSMQLRGGGAKGLANLPITTGAPSAEIKMPAVDGVLIESGDIVVDDLTRRYVVKSAELSALGWQLTALEAVV